MIRHASDDRTSSCLWRRLDGPGQDGCRLREHQGGWEIEGNAVFRRDGEAAMELRYRVIGGAAWRARAGRVHGWVGDREVDLTIARADDTWLLDGTPVPGLEHLVDLDFGFTPATNLPQLRRAALAIGQAAELPAAWLDVAAGTLGVLPQRYERRSERTYWYEAPTVGYAALLELDEHGFVSDYPGLWISEDRLA